MPVGLCHRFVINIPAISSSLPAGRCRVRLRRFNEAKGSLPPRTDVTIDSFSPFHRSQYDDFNRSRSQPPSITHGLAVAPDVLIELKSSIATYVTTWDLDETTRRFVTALSTE